MLEGGGLRRGGRAHPNRNALSWTVGCAVISFVGAGLAPTTPTLGALAADAALQGTASWWLLVFPGLAIVLPSGACLWAANCLTDAVPSTS